MLSLLPVAVVEKKWQRDDIFDDASGDVAIGDFGQRCEKYRQCVQLIPIFFRWLARVRDGADELGRIR